MEKIAASGADYFLEMFLPLLPEDRKPDWRRMVYDTVFAGLMVYEEQRRRIKVMVSVN